MIKDGALREDAARVLRTWRTGRLLLIAYLLVAAVGLSCLVIVTQQLTWLDSGVVIAGGWTVTALAGLAYRRAGRTLDGHRRAPSQEPEQTSRRASRPRRERSWPVRPRYTGAVAVSTWLGVILLLGYLTEHRVHDLVARTPVTAAVDSCVSTRGGPVCRGHWTVDDRTYYGIVPVTTWEQGQSVVAHYDPHHPAILADRPGTAWLTVSLILLITMATATSLTRLVAREAYLREVNRLAEGF
jgi:hypothetical protein